MRRLTDVYSRVESECRGVRIPQRLKVDEISTFYDENYTKTDA